MNTNVTSRPRIAVLLPMVWSVRNVVYSGVLERLARGGCDVHLLAPGFPVLPLQPPHLDFGYAAGFHPLLPATSRPIRSRALFETLLRASFGRKHKNRSYQMYRRWHERQSRLPARLRSAALDTAAAALRSDRALDWLRRRADTLYRQGHDLAPIRRQLESIAPDVLWSTVCVSPLEQPYLLAARAAGIPLFSSILSFDNLTSRGVLPRFDHYALWNWGMQRQLLRFYPDIYPEATTVTGTPQFDFHRNPKFRWSRERTLAALHLPSDARYFLYGGSSYTLTPDEPVLVGRLASHLAQQPEFSQHYLVVRLHPLDNWSRWEAVASASKKVVLSPSWAQLPRNDGWTLSSPPDQARLISSLTHSDACLHIASTIALDAAILDRPVIGLDFRREPDAPGEILYSEFEAEHYAPLVASGGLCVAHNWGELMGLLRRAVAHPEADREERAAMVRQECGDVDGCAGERLAATLLEFVTERIGRSAEKISTPKSAA